MAQDGLIRINHNFKFKIVPKKRLVGKDQLETIQTEIDIQYSCRHQNIVKMFSSWEESKMFCLILEYFGGGSLSSYAKTFPYRVS